MGKSVLNSMAGKLLVRKITDNFLDMIMKVVFLLLFSVFILLLSNKIGIRIWGWGNGEEGEVTCPHSWGLTHQRGVLSPWPSGRWRE